MYIQETAASKIHEATHALSIGDIDRVQILLGKIQRDMECEKIPQNLHRTLEIIQSEMTRRISNSPRKRQEKKVYADSLFPQTIKEGVSLVTCCMNRNENLKKSLRTWLRHNEISEIIIVDWSSSTPVLEDLSSSGLLDKKIKVIRVRDRPRWILTYAFNIGFSFARHKKILKVDADINLHNDFFKKNPLSDSNFIAGDWTKAEKGQEYINGFFFTHKDALAKIKGFNEYLTTYGWDDDDIYTRLSNLGLSRKVVNTSTIYHLEHSDQERTGKRGDNSNALETLTADTLFSIRRNKHIADSMPAWGHLSHPGKYCLIAADSGYVEISLDADSTPRVPRSVASRAEETALRELLAWKAGVNIPENTSYSTLTDVLSIIRLDDLKSQGIKLFTEKAKKPKVSPSPLTSTRQKLIVDAQHGLGNRLRAIGSAAAIAEKNDLQLVILWKPDDHCEARFESLFTYSGPVIQSLGQDFDISAEFNYMEIEEGSCKDELITIPSQGDILVKSAYALNSPDSSWAKENAFLQSLKPSPQVKALVESVDVEGRTGIHIRMEAGEGLDDNSWDDVSNWGEDNHKEIQYWRSKSHFSHFMRKIDDELSVNPDKKYFLATDLKSTYDKFRQRYPEETVSFLSRDSYDRSETQIIYALADAILLSKCSALYGSTWSSFSELALRLSTSYTEIKMSGKDF